MPSRARPFLLALTHTATLFSGCLLYLHFRPASNGGRRPGTAKSVAALPGCTAEELLKALTPALSLKEANAARREKALSDTRLAIRDLKAADFQAALDAEVAAWLPRSGEEDGRYSPRISALLYQWMLTDPEACGTWLLASEGNRNAAEWNMEAATLELLKRPGGIDTLLKACPDGNGLSLGSWLGQDPDSGLITQFKSRLKPEAWKSLCDSLGLSWPASRRQEMIDFAVSHNQARMLTNAARSGDATWLPRLYDDPSTPEEVRASLRMDGQYGLSFCGDATIPLERRLSILGASPFGYDRVAGQAIGRTLLAEGPDWSGLIRNGQATSQQALEAFSQAIPDLAAAAPDALRAKLFQVLASREAPQAIDLLADLPADQRNDIILTAARDPSSWYRIPLDSFTQIMAQLPVDAPELWDRRRSAWENEFGNALQNVSPENTAAWLEALPPGPDQQIALALGAKRFQADAPELAARLRRQVTDPRLANEPGEE